MSLIKISKEYFETFSNKDLPGLEELVSDRVRLRDWEISASGKKAVLKANKKIFDSVDNILVNILKMYEHGNTVVAELLIDINGGTELLFVVDIIEFDSEGKIKAIRAYKG